MVLEEGLAAVEGLVYELVDFVVFGLGVVGEVILVLTLTLILTGLLVKEFFVLGVVLLGNGKGRRWRDWGVLGKGVEVDLTSIFISISILVSIYSLIEYLPTLQHSFSFIAGFKMM